MIKMNITKDYVMKEIQIMMEFMMKLVSIGVRNDKDKERLEEIKRNGDGVLNYLKENLK